MINQGLSPKIVPIILAGGSGTRLWPLSTPACPKQFALLLGNKTLFQETLSRLKNIAGANSPVVICSKNHVALVQQQWRELSVSLGQIIAEPVGRNTAPAITIAALQFWREHEAEDPVMLVLPSDHAFKDVTAFAEAINCAYSFARQNFLVCFGITPRRPEPGFGYIEFGPKLDDPKIYQVARFVEKPSREKAAEYLALGGFYWNSGIFMFRASSYLAALKKHAPDIFTSCQETLLDSHFEHGILHLSEKVFINCRSDSIDYAIMEKAENVVALPLDAGWSDIGSWEVLSEYNSRNASGNLLVGKVKAEKIKNSYIHSTKRQIVVIGVENLIVVETEDAVLVLRKENSQDLKKSLEDL
jgi:mannose-1-phosphate guanylyltransferase/mannose-6-phosphate isomerase